mmetsp:Transcript_5021/g.12991  ORF Transcript_5021/g.12991 Transcript_5021/m.12991 type:complete len:254 (-) Transcript_5021:121-882(-)
MPHVGPYHKPDRRWGGREARPLVPDRDLGVIEGSEDEGRAQRGRRLAPLASHWDDHPGEVAQMLQRQGSRGVPDQGRVGHVDRPAWRVQELSQARVVHLADQGEQSPGIPDLIHRGVVLQWVLGQPEQVVQADPGVVGRQNNEASRRPVHHQGERLRPPPRSAVHKHNQRQVGRGGGPLVAPLCREPCRREPLEGVEVERGGDLVIGDLLGQVVREKRTDVQGEALGTALGPRPGGEEGFHRQVARRKGTEQP